MAQRGSPGFGPDAGVGVVVLPAGDAGCADGARSVRDASDGVCGVSLALVVSALLGRQAGRAIDRWGGRPVLLGTNLVFAAGLGLLARARCGSRRRWVWRPSAC